MLTAIVCCTFQITASDSPFQKFKLSDKVLAQSCAGSSPSLSQSQGAWGGLYSANFFCIGHGEVSFGVCKPLQLVALKTKVC